jgi:hypothetical protein
LLLLLLGLLIADCQVNSPLLLQLFVYAACECCCCQMLLQVLADCCEISLQQHRSPVPLQAIFEATVEQQQRLLSCHGILQQATPHDLILSLLTQMHLDKITVQANKSNNSMIQRCVSKADQAALSSSTAAKDHQ